MSEIIDKAQRGAALLSDAHERGGQAIVEAQEVLSGLVRADLLPEAAARVDREWAALDQLLEQRGISAAEDYERLTNDELSECVGRLEAVSQAALDSETRRVLQGLDRESLCIPEEELKTIREYFDLFQPALVKYCEETLVEVERDPDLTTYGFIYAFLLLIELAWDETLPLIRRALTVPDHMATAIFAELHDEIMPRVLATLAEEDDDDFEEIERIAGSTDYDPFCRWGAITAYRYLLRDERISRDEVAERVMVHLRQAISEEKHKLVTGLVVELCDYAIDKSLVVIEEAFDAQLVETFMITFDGVQQALGEGEARTNRMLAELGPTRITDADEVLHTASWLKTDTDLESPDDVESSWPPHVPPAGVGPSFERIGPPPELAPPVEPIEPVEPLRRDDDRVGRNEPCPCGSGRKYKKCCLRK